MIAADTTISSVKKNPALAYLSRLGSARSVITISNCLKHIANILGAKDIESSDWSKLKRTHWTEIQKKLSAQGCCGSTQNLYLTAFKTVAKEAWTLNYQCTRVQFFPLTKTSMARLD